MILTVAKETRVIQCGPDWGLFSESVSDGAICAGDCGKVVLSLTGINAYPQTMVALPWGRSLGRSTRP